jgi:hypothetical protein
MNKNNCQLKAKGASTRTKKNYKPTTKGVANQEQKEL